MKLIIAGSRHLGREAWLPLCKKMVSLGFHGGHPTPEGIVDATVSEVISGTCSGGDILGEEWASVHMIPVKEFPADWKKHGRAAGPIRNQQMAEYADALVLIWDGNSRGSQNMKYNMIQMNKPVYEVIV